jgi:hypothetical protein
MLQIDNLFMCYITMSIEEPVSKGGVALALKFNEDPAIIKTCSYTGPPTATCFLTRAEMTESNDVVLNGKHIINMIQKKSSNN